MKVKIDKLDRVFSKLVRTRDRNRCVRCGATGCKIDASHIYSRRHQATRFSLANVHAHCFNCHRYLGGNPVEFDAWAREYLGDGMIEILREKHNTICKRPKHEKEAMYKHFVAELDRLLDARDRGEEYEVVGWE